LGLHLIERQDEDLVSFEKFRGQVVNLSNRFASQVPSFLKLIDSLEDLNGKMKTSLESKSSLCDKLKSKVKLGFELFLSDISKNSAQIEYIQNSNWVEICSWIKQCLIPKYPELKQLYYDSIFDSQNEHKMKKTLRLINFLLEAIFCKKTKENYLVLQFKELFKNFYDMIIAQKSNSNKANIFNCNRK
jgi:hypothetical protein